MRRAVPEAKRGALCSTLRSNCNGRLEGGFQLAGGQILELLMIK